MLTFFFRCHRQDRKECGYTLIEVMMALSLLGLVAAVIFSSLIQGTKIYNRLSAVSDGQDTALMIEQMTRDLKNQSPLSTLPRSFETSSFVMTVTDSIREYPLSVRYRFIPEKNVISRSVLDYPYTHEKESAVLGNVSSVGYQWIMTADKRPSGVEVTLVRGGQAGQAREHLISFPTGYDAPAG